MLKHNTEHKNWGFTLIELSITLVVIGLVIGGILVGKDLIKSFEIRAQVKQVEELKSAVNTFKIKYGYLPGDMPPAQAGQLGFFQFVGSDAGTTYGNNDGFIRPHNESFPAFSHLSDAKLIKGQYGGVAGNLLQSNTAFYPGIPLASVDGVDFYSKYLPTAQIGGKAVSVLVYSGNIIHDPVYFSTPAYTIGSLTLPYPFTALEMYTVDKKNDDGFPESGVVRNYSGDGYYDNALEEFVSKPCITGTGGNIRYDLSSETANDKNCNNLYIK